MAAADAGREPIESDAIRDLDQSFGERSGTAGAMKLTTKFAT
jgi:hypothetical protein